MIRVALIDDMDMIRTGFKLIVDNEPDMTVVGEAANGREAIDLCRNQRVDVVLMDIRMPELDGLAASRTILDICLLYTSPSPRDLSTSRMPSSA